MDFSNWTTRYLLLEWYRTNYYQYNCNQSSTTGAAGIQVDGYSYKWIFKNGNANWFSGQGRVDPLEVVVNVYDSNGNLYKSYTYDYGTQFSNWKTHTGTELFGALGLDPTWFGNLEVLITAKDIEGLSGYYV